MKHFGGQKRLTYSAGVAVAAVAIAVGGCSTAPDENSAREELIQAEVEAAKKMMPLPYKADEFTTLVALEAETDAIHYSYELDGVDPAAVSEEVIRDLIQPGLCEAPETLALLEQDVAMTYSYEVVETGDVYEVSFTEADC
jgi:hypothetical protein